MGQLLPQFVDMIRRLSMACMPQNFDQLITTIFSFIEQALNISPESQMLNQIILPSSSIEDVNQVSGAILLCELLFLTLDKNRLIHSFAPLCVRLHLITSTYRQKFIETQHQLAQQLQEA